MAIKTAPGLRTRSNCFQIAIGGITSQVTSRISCGGSHTTASKVPGGTFERTSMESPRTTRTLSDACVVSLSATASARSTATGASGGAPSPQAARR